MKLLVFLLLLGALASARDIRVTWSDTQAGVDQYRVYREPLTLLGTVAGAERQASVSIPNEAAVIFVTAFSASLGESEPSARRAIPAAVLLPPSDVQASVVTGPDPDPDPGPDPDPDPGPDPDPDPDQSPSQVINLRDWKLTLPVADVGGDNADHVEDLIGYRHPDFFFANARGAVEFRTPTNGVTTSGSTYPRTELREMLDGDEAAWPATGFHRMQLRQAILAVPVNKPELVAAQIHNDSDVIVLRLEGRKLLLHIDGQDFDVVDSDYRLGQVYTFALQVSDGVWTAEYTDPEGVKIAYNVTANIHVSSSHRFYFKAGCYPQSNPSRGDARIVCATEIYDLLVVHRN